MPLFEDIPFVGAAFRPAPSDESSIQQNIILGRTTVYPTVFDLMGLRWAPHVVDVDHLSLLDSEHIVRGRRRTIKDYVFHAASEKVDQILKLEKEFEEHYRPDFHHRQRQPSPHHPSGYIYRPKVDHNRPGPPATEPLEDPTGRRFERTDRRPPEAQQPPYDLYRHLPVSPQPIEAGPNLDGARIAPLPPPIGQTWSSPDQATPAATQWKEVSG